MSTKEENEGSGRRGTRSSRRRRGGGSNAADKDSVMIAPGFGTRKDLMQLSEDLSRGNDTKLPVEAVEAMMQSRGRGIVSRQKESEDETPRKTRTAGDDTTTANKATPVSSAWADFMKDEGLDTLLPTSSGTRSSRKTKDNDASNNTTTANPTGSSTTTKANNGGDENPNLKKRQYDFDALQPPSKKAKTSTFGKKKGLLVQAGSLDCTMIGRGKFKADDFDKFEYNLHVPTKILPDIYISRVYTSPHAVHNIATDIGGNVYGWGRNDQKQLTSSMPKNVAVPTLLTDLAGPIHSAALGKSHTIFLMEKDRSLVACGLNKAGQCGINRKTMELVPNLKPCVFHGVSKSSSDSKKKGGDDSSSSNSPTIIQVACGEDFSLAVDSDGYLYSTGSSEFGQLGDGETGEYFISASKLAFRNCHLFTKRTTFVYEPNLNIHQTTKHRDKTKVVPLPHDVRIQSIACGKHHSLALEAPSVASDDGKSAAPRVFSWGCGDYGCLGHGVQADEYYPRLVESLQQQLIMYAQNQPQTSTGDDNSDNILISAGAHCSLLCSKRNGYVYYWGKHKTAGEAVMKPSLIDQLANNQHMVTHIGAGGQTVVCSTLHKQTIAWGQGPYGELGIGSKKSSAKPAFVESLDGIGVLDLACGYGTTLWVVQENEEQKDDKDKESSNNNKLVENLPQIESEAVSEQLESYWKTLKDSGGETTTEKSSKGRKKSSS